jgi:hypothetical protein
VVRVAPRVFPDQVGDAAELLIERGGDAVQGAFRRSAMRAASTFCYIAKTARESNARRPS